MELRIRPQRRRGGMAMVEFTIILPFLLFLLFGAIETSVLLLRYQTINNAAREGARRAVLFRVPCNKGTVQAEVLATVARYAARSQVPGVTATVDTTNVCEGAGLPVTVTASHTYNWFVVGGLASMVGESLQDGIQLDATATMTNE